MGKAKRKSKRKGKGKAPEIVLRGTGSAELRARPVPGSVHVEGKMGAPTKFSPEMGALICERIAAGESRTQLCADPKMPSVTTIRRWLMNPAKLPELEDFSRAYARAKELRTEHYEDEILDISDDGSNDYVDREIGRGRIVRMADQEHIQRSRLRVDSRKWLMAKLNPKKYGDKVDVSLGGRDSSAIPLVAMTAEEATREYLKMLEKPPDEPSS